MLFIHIREINCNWSCTSSELATACSWGSDVGSGKAEIHPQSTQGAVWLLNSTFLCWGTSAGLVWFRFVSFVELQNCTPWCSSCAENKGVFLEWKLPGTPAAAAALHPAPEGSHSLNKCLCEIKTDHLFPQILSNNLSLIKSKILFAWLPVELERNYHPCFQLWGKWGKAINDLGWGMSGVHGELCSLQDTDPLHLQPPTPCRSLGDLEIVIWGFISAFNTCPRNTHL